MTPTGQTFLRLIFLCDCRYHVTLISRSYIILLSQSVSYLMIECMETERYEKFHEVQVQLNVSDASMITPIYIC